ncbi:DUF1801 domain-containing protein [Caulobacter sp. X]|uniref:DUF1801 domain-containing protein n=1 Tax=Caulobacter sp. X TaxID=2048901 RepID=UPI000C161D2E|nr:DUF1801 domain-containing protein [Caulobacter sp. X]PIB97206.1 hypothetical protein CSW60_21255 [Caulobacter sp. X]
MVQSKAANVDDFLAEVPPDRRPALDRLRGLCRERFGAERELMAFGMPGYGDPKAPLVSFNSQKHYIALYVGRAALDAFPERMAGVDRGGGCARWKKAEAIDFDLVADLLDHVREHGRGAC